MRRTSEATGQMWRERVEAQRAGGLSIRAWCRANNYHEHAFYLWRSRLGLSPASAARLGSPRATKRRRDAAGPIQFAEVVADRANKLWPSATDLESIRLRLAEGRELVLPASLPPGYLAQLIHAIEGRPLIKEPA